MRRATIPPSPILASDNKSMCFSYMLHKRPSPELTLNWRHPVVASLGCAYHKCVCCPIVRKFIHLIGTSFGSCVRCYAIAQPNPPNGRQVRDAPNFVDAKP
jgi:hypothetical protein